MNEIEQSVEYFNISKQKLVEKGREIVLSKAFKNFLIMLNDMPNGTKLRADSPIFIKFNKVLGKHSKELIECMRDFFEKHKVLQKLIYAHALEKFQSLLDDHAIPIFMNILSNLDKNGGGEEGFLKSFLELINHNVIQMSSEIIAKVTKEEELNGVKGNDVTIH